MNQDGKLKTDGEIAPLDFIGDLELMLLLR